MKRLPRPAATQQELLQKALRAFEGVTGLHIEHTTLRDNRGDVCPDAALQIEVPGCEKKIMHAEVKDTLTQTAIGRIAEQLRDPDNPAILVTRYVTPQQAEQLKMLKIPFMDTAGNAYIDAPPLFVYVTGKKTELEDTKAKTVRAFRPAGLRIVFALLCNPRLADAPYRDIARIAGVALGTVGWVMHDLKRLGYLMDKGACGRKTANAKKLFNVWVDTYARDLRPKIYLGRFTATEPLLPEQIDCAGLGVMLGGETAAAILTRHLKPETLTVYVPEKNNADELMLKYRLRKDAHGNVELLTAFWNFDYQWDFKGIAPPLLVYADLVATENDRNIETARIVYDRYIARHLEQD